MKELLDKNTKAILFDLDGTLLEINLDLFVSQYIKLWAQSVAHLISFNKFIARPSYLPQSPPNSSWLSMMPWA